MGRGNFPRNGRHLGKALNRRTEWWDPGTEPPLRGGSSGWRARSPPRSPSRRGEDGPPGTHRRQSPVPVPRPGPKPDRLPHPGPRPPAVSRRPAPRSLRTLQTLKSAPRSLEQPSSSSALEAKSDKKEPEKSSGFAWPNLVQTLVLLLTRRVNLANSLTSGAPEK